MNILEAANQKGNENQHREDSTHADNQVESRTLEFLRESLYLVKTELGDISALYVIAHVRNNLTLTAVCLNRHQNVFVVHFLRICFIQRRHGTDAFPYTLPAL